MSAPLHFARVSLCFFDVWGRWYSISSRPNTVRYWCENKKQKINKTKRIYSIKVEKRKKKKCSTKKDDLSICRRSNFHPTGCGHLIAINPFGYRNNKFAHANKDTHEHTWHCLMGLLTTILFSAYQILCVLLTEWTKKPKYIATGQVESKKQKTKTAEHFFGHTYYAATSKTSIVLTLCSKVQSTATRATT